MCPSVVARHPPRPRARLNLAPRLHTDETLSSWLERFAGAYNMTLREFFLWLGYPDFLGYCQVPYDLDVSPPPDLAGLLASHAGLGAELLAAHRLDAFDALPLRRRRTFCPECWTEEGPYRRLEWAHGWSLVCRRHRRLLSERPRPKVPSVRWHEESWTDFYQDTNAWRDLRPSWESEPWRAICQRLGVEPRTEFLRAWPWLIELSRPAQDPACVEDPRVDEVTAKQDVALYAMIRFFDFSLLEALDMTSSREELMTDTSGGSLCDARTPNVPYRIRLFAVMVARHLWARLTQGRWQHCGRYEALKRAFRRRRRWNDEVWWLEQRLRTWPVALEDAGRRLFRRTDPFVLMPPWERCRECARDDRRAIRGAFDVCLPIGWRCLNRNPAVKAEAGAIFARYSSGARESRSAAGLDCTAPD